MGKKSYFHCMRFLKNNLHLNPNAYNLKILNHKVNLSLTVYYHNFLEQFSSQKTLSVGLKKLKYFQQQQISPKTNNWQKICIEAAFSNALWNKIRKLHILTDLNWFAKLSSCLKSYITNVWKNEIQRWKKMSYQFFYKMKMQFDLPKTLFKNVESWGLIWLLSNLVFGTIFYTE